MKFIRIQFYRPVLPEVTTTRTEYWPSPKTINEDAMLQAAGENMARTDPLVADGWLHTVKVITKSEMEQEVANV